MVDYSFQSCSDKYGSSNTRKLILCHQSGKDTTNTERTMFANTCVIAFGLLIKAAIGVLRSRNSGLTFYQYIAYKGMRDYQSGLKAVEIQNLLPSTSKTCRKFARKHSIEQSAIELPDGTVAHWLGPRKASNVVVFFHGGGYMSPILSAHLSLAFGFSKPSDRDVCVVVLPYGTSCPL